MYNFKIKHFYSFQIFVFQMFSYFPNKKSLNTEILEQDNLLAACLSDSSFLSSTCPFPIPPNPSLPQPTEYHIR